MTEKFRSAYSAHVRKPIICDEKSLTQQCFKQECDVNHILRKYRKTQLLEHVNTYQGNYGDVSNIPDLQTALSIVTNAHEAFNSVPSDIRKKFDNDPIAFVNFASNPDNLDSLRELGLAKPIPPVTVPETPAPAPVEPAAGAMPAS